MVECCYRLIASLKIVSYDAVGISFPPSGHLVGLYIFAWYINLEVFAAIKKCKPTFVWANNGRLGRGCSLAVDPLE